MKRFEAKIKKTDLCWLWTGFLEKTGYGKFWFDGKVRRAHRVAWQLYKGQLDEKMQVLHTCDNPSCVRPSHLFLGSPLDNMRDKEQKGRANHARGVRARTAKLTEQEVKLARSLHREGKSIKALAAEFKVHGSTMSRLIRRKYWSHI